MNAVDDLLARLARQNVRLWVEEDQLRYNAPRGAMGARSGAALAAHCGHCQCELAYRRSCTPLESA